MSKITPIDVIKGISGKYGNGSNDYFATNSSSNKIRLAKLNNPYQGPYTEEQLAQQAKFKTRAAAATAWLNQNKPSTDNPDGTAAYQALQKLKRQYGLSSVTQVLYKYIDESGNLSLPESITGATADASDSGTGASDAGNGSNNSGSGSNDSGNSGSGSNTGGTTPNDDDETI